VQRKLIATALAIGFAVVLGACGGGHSVHNAAGGRTVDIDMRDNDFSPASISVKAGEQVQFVFHNKGALAHDAYIGDESAQTAHEQDMKMSSSMAGMDHGGHGTDGITVDAGQTGTLSHTFDKSGTTIIGCHQLEHYMLGMRINVNVT
jgi:uncharacterized cupredoxin-like copper-binding protein